MPETKVQTAAVVTLLTIRPIAAATSWNPVMASAIPHRIETVVPVATTYSTLNGSLALDDGRDPPLRAV